MRLFRIILLLLVIGSYLRAQQMEYTKTIHPAGTALRTDDIPGKKPAKIGKCQNGGIWEGLTLGYFKGVYSIQSSDYVSSVTLSMHVPVIHRETSPIFFRLLETSPPGKVVEYHTSYKGGDNWIAQVRFDNMNPGDAIVIPWECWTLKKNQAFLDMPVFIDTTSLASLHDSLDCYLTASAYIQSDHPDIIAKAEELAGAGNNVVQFAREVIAFTGDTLPYEPYGAQDALTTLQRGYAVCTGKANLAVALLRVLHVPARVLMVAFTHYIIEFYLPEYGWVRAESTVGYLPCRIQDHTVMLACNLQEENFSGYMGVMCYWGTDNADIGFDILYGQAERDECAYEILSEESLGEHVLSVSRDVWRKYNDCLNRELSEDQRGLFSQALTHQEEAVAFFVDNDLYSVTGQLDSALAIYHDIETTVPSVHPVRSPGEYVLFQNYPNPFNPLTVIQYYVPERGFVSLRIYSLLGREIETLEEGEKEKGVYEVHWDASALPSGIYLCRMTADDFMDTRKLIVQK